MSEAILKIIFEASLTAGIAAAAVMLIRISLKKAPKRWSYLLWAVVFFRCLCPFSVESAVSVFNAVPNQTAAAAESSPAVNNTEARQDIGETAPSPLPSGATFYNPYYDYGYIEPRYADYSGYAKFGADTDSAENKSEAAVTYTDAAPEKENAVNVYTVLAIVWAAGAAAMTGYGAVSYIKLMRKIRSAVKAEDGVYETDLIPTAFSAGFFPPRVYVPCGLSDTERRLIVTHERVHIRRFDHIAKPLAFIALTMHWFNPLIWAAFALMTKDMELSCDEAVLKICGAEEKKNYSRALLRVSMKKSGLAVIPLEFAGMGIKGRVKNVLGYKKPRAAATALAAAMVISACAVLGTNAVQTAEEPPRVLLGKGTTEFTDKNGENILFAYGDRAETVTYSGEDVDVSYVPVIRYRDGSGTVQSLRSASVAETHDRTFRGLETKSVRISESGYNLGSAGGIDIDCAVSEITINDIYLKYNNGYYCAAVSLDILADDTLPEKTGVFSWNENAADFEIHGENGAYTVTAEIKAQWDDGSGGERYCGLMLYGFDDIPVYAAGSLNISDYIGDPENESEQKADGKPDSEPEKKHAEEKPDGEKNAENAAASVTLEKGKTEFAGSGGDRIFLSYKEENPHELSYTPEALEALEKYSALDEDMEYVAFPDCIGTGGGFRKSSIPAFKTEIYSQWGNNKRTDSSLIGAAFDVEIDHSVRKLAVNDLDVRRDDGRTLLCLDFDLWSDEAWSIDSAALGKTVGSDPSETSSVISVVPYSEDGRICNIRAELEVPEGNVGYGLVLTGFEDIPITAEGKAAERFVYNLANDEVKQVYQAKQKELQDAEEASPYPSLRLPVRLANIGEYGASDSNILFSLPKGTEVVAAADGTVKSAETGFNGGYGNCIEISHKGGMSTLYAHLDEFAAKVGDEVKEGDVIGYSGSSGAALGNSLIFEIRIDGEVQNPGYYFYFPMGGYRSALEEISKDRVSDGIAGIYSEDGRLVDGNNQKTIEIDGETYCIISTEAQLRAIAAGEYGMDKNFLQNGNIYLSSDEWIPIGTKDDPFTGTYSGNGFEIIGLTMKDPDAARVGMFGWAKNAEIHNITLRDYDIESAGSNAPQTSVAPILPVVTGGTRCYDNNVYPVKSGSVE